MRLKREVFLYTEAAHAANQAEYAQCQTCMHFLQNKQRCYLLGKNFAVDGDDSCNLHTEKIFPAEKSVDKEPQGLYTPEEVGFVKRPVRCENCYFGGAADCALYTYLNKKLPQIFDLETKINPKGCCCANSKKSNGD